MYNSHVNGISHIPQSNFLTGYDNGILQAVIIRKCRLLLF
jgi:hypothetical protein